MGFLEAACVLASATTFHLANELPTSSNAATLPREKLSRDGASCNAHSEYHGGQDTEEGKLHFVIEIIRVVYGCVRWWKSWPGEGGMGNRSSLLY
ncbi:hypothetical protein F4818DRAFT_433157 [Hypoxylon cercidicola]|nr:hypothetical protein F4818DRAFT_433157 [Hypoxylon cercidicola]